MSKQDDDSLESVDDELSAYDDFVRAVQAPGSASELADEARFRTAFRETHGSNAPVISLPSRLTRRLGVGGSAVVVVVAVSSGVAAAVTGNLPDPVQEFAHTVIGAPAPQPPALKRAVPAELKPIPDPDSTSTSDSATPAPSEPSAPESSEPAKPGKATSSSEPAPANPGVVAPTNGPGDEPTPEPPPVTRPIPAALTMSAASHLSPYGGTILLAGRVTTEDGSPIANRKVTLQVRSESGWRRLVRATSDSSGAVVASTSPVTGLDRYRWRVHAPVRSSVWRVRVKPVVSASYLVSGDQTTVIATTVGARPGDPISLYARVKKQPTLVGEAVVGTDGTAQFTVTTPVRRPRSVVVRLGKTRDHAPARTRLKVPPPG